MEPFTKTAPLGTLSSKPPLRSSRTTTLWPRLRSSSATCDPIKPAPPVTNEVDIFLLFLSSALELSKELDSDTRWQPEEERFAPGEALPLFPQNPPGRCPGSIGRLRGTSPAGAEE